MDLLSILGVIIGFTAIIGGNFLEGGQWQTLVNLPAALIVIGGTLGAVALQTPRSVFVLALIRARWIVTPPLADFGGNLRKIVSWSQVARREGLLGLEKLLSKESNGFAKKGLELLVDGFEPVEIRRVLELEVNSLERSNREAAHVFESMGGYAPTIGIIGAVLGLIHVMGDLQDPSTLGTGIAVAFVATIYGVGFANLLLIPFANKIRAYGRQQTQLQAMLIEGLVSIAEGENPRAIDQKLRGFFV